MSFKWRQIGEEHLVILSMSFVVYKMQTAEVMSSPQLSAVLSVKWPGRRGRPKSQSGKTVRNRGVAMEETIYLIYI